MNAVPNWRDALSDTQRFLDALGTGLIIGGAAVSLVAEPRLTQDIDVLVVLHTEDVAGLVRTAARHSLVPRISDAEDFAQTARIVLLRHEPTGVDVDVSLGALLFEQEADARATRVSADGIVVRLPTPEDLVIMKAVAHRPKDILDIQAIAAVHPDLDRARVEHWVRVFGEALDMPELWDDIAGLLSR
jgi:predicted nucleotidyltransferase